MRRCAVLALLPVACIVPPTPIVDDVEAPIVLPHVEGMTPAEDLDPDPDCVEYELTVSEAQIEFVPGTKAWTWAYNGMVPGPLMQAEVGQHVHVRVTNDLSEPTTIHWHGLRIENAMDGVVHGEMKAIEPGETFTYQFAPPEAGTFWYHPHIRPNVQIERGLYGMFVVHEKRATRPDVDVERAFMFDDIVLDDDGASVNNQFGGGMETMHGRYGDTLLVNGQDRVVDVALGGVERWRIGNSANARTMYLRFTGLDVVQIGADGGLWPQSDVRPLTGDLELPVGARAELLVRMPLRGAEGRVDNVVLALDENDEVVEVPIPQVRVTRDGGLRARAPRRGHFADPTYERVDPASGSTHGLLLSGENTGAGIQFTINGTAWPDFEEWSVTAGDQQIIKIRNALGMEHPFHLHGQFFTILQRDDEDVDEPGLRDTILIPPQATVKLATRFENPGMWMYHCHILEHEEAGMMAMVDVEGGGATMSDHE